MSDENEQPTTAIATTVREKPAPIAVDKNVLTFKNSEDLYRWAGGMANSGHVPKDYVGKPHAILAAVQHGGELGLSPMQSLKSIAVINGTPCLWGDGLVALMHASGKLADHKTTWSGEGDKLACTFSVFKKGIPTPFEWTFSLQDAKTANLLGKGTWASHPRRMLFNRARAFAVRDAFAEELRGLGVDDEIMDYSHSTAPVQEQPKTNFLEVE